MVHENYRCQPVDFLSVWEEDVARAQLASILPRSFHKHLPELPRELRSLVNGLEKKENAFDVLRAEFLRRHGKSLIESLDQCTEGRRLMPAPLAAEVSDHFLAACGKRVTKISPGFHGTSGKVHESICSRGLLIPGQNNDIKVVNGSAHGNGVYIAKLSNPWLAQGFARDVNKMFVCGVVDDAVNLSQAGKLGSYHVTKQSANVSHVGDAMVVFDSMRVAPLFVAEWTQVCHNFATVTVPKQARRSQVKRVLYRGECVRRRDTWAWNAVKHRRGKWLDVNWGQWRCPLFFWGLW